jgi:hypothetical protein
MLNRTLIRGFKTWTQYYAEKIGITEHQWNDIKKKLDYGAFDIWKHRNEVTQKIHFILDHCTPEEQKVYLKEFSSEDLAIFLRSEVYTMSDEDLKGLEKMKITFHVLPGVNMFLKYLYWFKFLGIQGDKNLTAESKLRRFMIEALNLKLKELEWKKVDRQISGSI